MLEKQIIIWFFLTQLGDWYTTRTVLKQGGVEANPIMAKVFAVLNVDVALALKAVITTYLLSFVVDVQPMIAVGLSAFYTFVVYHNWKQIK